MNKASLLSILIVAFALNACGNAFVTPQVEDAEQRHGVAVGQQSEPPVAGAASTGLSYLEATIEACSDIDGYERDPCERDRFQDEEYYWISYRHPDQPVIKSLLEVDGHRDLPTTDDKRACTIGV